MSIILISLSIYHSTSLTQGIEAQEVTIAYDEISLANWGTIVRLDWAPDGQALAISTGNDLRIYTYDLIEIAHWQGHTALITSIDWKPDGTSIATASRDGKVRIWDTVVTSPTYGTTLYTLPHANRLLGVRWSPAANENRLASIEFMGLEETSDSARSLATINIWDVDTQSVELTLPTQRNIANVVWSPDGQYLAYSGLQFSRDYVISVSNASTGQLIGDFEGSIARINEVAWQPNGSTLAYVDDLNAVVTTNVSAQGGITYLNEFRAPPTERAYTVDWSSDGTELAMGGTDNKVYLWNPLLNEAQVFSSPHHDDVIQVAWSPTGERIASLSRGGVVRVWQLDRIDHTYCVESIYRQKLNIAA
jgi:WD40 repeat protein